MKNYIFTSLFLLFLASHSLQGQDFRMGKVSKEELEEKSHPSDSSAVAAVLYKKGNTQFNFDNRGEFVLNTDVEVRLKVYKKEGLEFANFSIPYYVGGQKETVIFNDVASYNLVNGKVEKTKIKKEGEFDEQVNENWKIKKIVLPNVKEGSVIEFKYTHKTPYLTSIPDWYFQENIPVNVVTYNVSIPEYFNYGIVLNSTDISVKQEIKSQSKTLTSNQKNSYGTSSGSSLQTVSYNETHTFYSAKDLPAIDEENFVTNIKNYAASVKHELSTIRFPNNYRELSLSWNDVATTIYKNDNFGKELSYKSYFEDDLKSILIPGMTQNEKIKSILSFVKQNVAWNNKTGIYCDQGVRKAYKNKTGNVADINLILTVMLRYAGLDANPVLVSTRDNGISAFPKINAFNYIIVAVEAGNEVVLLDASNKHSASNILPIKTLNWKGRLIRENGTTDEVDLIPNVTSKKVIYVMADIQENGALSGKIRHQNFDYNAFLFREMYGSTSLDSYLEQTESKYGGLEIGNDYKRINLEDLQKPVSEDFSFTHDNSTDVIGDKMYFSPMIFYKWSKNPFTKEERKYPIDFIFPFSEKHMLNYSFPDGYQIENTPESISLSLPDNIGSFKYLLSSNENKIQISIDFNINEAVISEMYYPDLKDFFKRIMEKQNEKIVLKKI